MTSNFIEKIIICNEKNYCKYETFYDKSRWESFPPHPGSTYQSSIEHLPSRATIIGRLMYIRQARVVGMAERDPYHGRGTSVRLITARLISRPVDLTPPGAVSDRRLTSDVSLEGLSRFDNRPRGGLRVYSGPGHVQS